MNLIQLLMHAGVLVTLGKDFQSISQNLIEHKEKFPSKEEFMRLIDDAIGVVGSGMFRFPLADMNVVLQSLNALKAGLQ